MGQRGPGAKPVTARPRPLQKPARKRRDGRTRAAKLIAWVEALIIPSGLHAGRKFKVRPWQRTILERVYSTDAAGMRPVRLALLSMARKNGKSGLVAALALAHLCGPEAVQGGQVLSGAADRAQAAIIYAAMKAMAIASPELADRLIFRDFKKEIEDVMTGSTYQALSSDARKAHGMSPSFWIADEVAQWHGRDLLDAMRTGTGAHAEPLGWVISTRSPDPINPLEELISYADQVNSGIIEDATFAGFVFSAPLDADPWAEETWHLANPALGDFRSMGDLRMQAMQAQRLPSMEASFRAYSLNQPIGVDERFIAPADWDACAGTAEAIGPCWGGLDLSSGPADLTAFSLFWAETGLLRVWSFLPEASLEQKASEDRAPYRQWAAAGHVIIMPGRAIDRAWLGQWIARQVDGLELVGIATDRWGLADLVTQLDREGIVLPLEPMGQGFKDFSPALSAFEAAVLEAKVQHGGNPLLRWAVSNAAVDMDPAGGRKLSKQRARGRIDPLVAAVEAVGQAARAPAVPDYQFTGMLLGASPTSTAERVLGRQP